MRYADVCISHTQKDQARAAALKQRIIGWSLSCHIDADDPELERIKNAPDSDPQALADRIRQHLRTCRCLIYAFSSQSLKSRCMPWDSAFSMGAEVL